MIDEEIIYLIMDNAKIHGTNEAMLYFTDYMSDNHNIVVGTKYYKPPKTNSIDLGSWTTVQSKVKKYHRHNTKQQDARSRSINREWFNMEEHKITKIWTQYLKVLYITIQHQGGNGLV